MFILKNKEIGKFGWNIKFEHNWVQNKLGVEVQNWIHDGMLMSHLLDNRAGTKVCLCRPL